MEGGLVWVCVNCDCNFCGVSTAGMGVSKGSVDKAEEREGERGREEESERARELESGGERERNLLSTRRMSCMG